MKKLNKPGLIRKFFIYWRIERIQAGELALQTYLKKVLDELCTLKPGSVNDARIRFLFFESNKTTDKIKVLQDKKKDLYFKFL